MIEVTVNGAARQVETGDLQGLVAEIGLDAEGRGIAVALDGRVVPRPEWPSTPVRPGARIDIVGATQGG